MKLFFLAIVVLSASSCFKKTADTSNKKVLQLFTPSKVKGMDPIYSSDYSSVREIGRVYEGLLQYQYLKRPYALEGNLAEGLPTVSDDGMTYTFKIKKNVFFHDDKAFTGGKGRELTAHDFVYSIKRLSDPKLQGLGWWLLDGKIQGLNEWRDKYIERSQTDYDEEIEGLKVLDRYTLQFKLAKPFPQFLYALAMPFTFAVAREVVEHYGSEFLNHPVGTGPFVISRFLPQANRIVYNRNPSFREKRFPCDSSPEYQMIAKASCGKKLPLVDKVVVHVMVEDQPRWLNFQKGNLDFLDIPKDNFSSVVPDAKNLSSDYAKKGISLSISPSLNVTYISLNHDLKLFQDINLRRAMSLAYNIHEANRLFQNSTGLPAQSVVPPGIAGYTPSYKNPYQGEGTTEHIKKAKDFLVKAGYPEGKGLPIITYDCRNGSVARQEGEYFRKQMEQIGIKISVIQNTWPQLQKKILTRQVMTFGIGWGADYPDAENFLQLLYGPNRSPGPNGAGYNDPTFNKLFQQAASMQDSPQRSALYERLNLMVADALPWIFGVHRQRYVLKHRWLKNFVPTDFDTDRVLYLDIDVALKKETMKML